MPRPVSPRDRRASLRRSVSGSPSNAAGSLETDRRKSTEILIRPVGKRVESHLRNATRCGLRA